MFTFLEIYGMQACALNALENQMDLSAFLNKVTNFRSAVKPSRKISKKRKRNQELSKSCLLKPFEVLKFN